MKLIESVIDGMITMLKAQLPVKLMAMNGEATDGVVLDPPALYLDYEPNVQEVAERPLLMVLAGQSKPSADTGFGGGGWADYDHLVAIGYLAEDADPQALSKKLIRVQAAIVQVVGANRQGVKDKDGDSAWGGLSIVVTDPGERFRMGSMNSYVQVTQITVKATKVEG